MVCPNCGKEVTDAIGLCPFCGACVSRDNPTESHRAAALEGSEASFEQLAHISRSASASLILGILSFASLPIAVALGYLGFLTLTLFVGSIATGISLGLLAVITGHRAKVSIQRGHGRISGADRAIRGMASGYLSLGIWLLPVVLYFVGLALPHPLEGGNPGLGSLRVITEAAAAYSCSYGHGFPSTLAAMGPAKTRWLQGAPSPNDKAAGFISEELASGLKSGYQITYTAGPADSSGKIQTFTAHADPVNRGTGQFDLYYFTDQTGVIRTQARKKANPNSGPIADGGDLRSVDCSDAYNFRNLARQFPVTPERDSSK